MGNQETALTDSALVPWRGRPSKVLLPENEASWSTRTASRTRSSTTGAQRAGRPKLLADFHDYALLNWFLCLRTSWSRVKLTEKNR
jgi:hypothetical protein